MKRITNLLFSTRLTAILLLLFALSIAVATFIESDFGNSTAHVLIYNAWWFNLMLFIGIINLLGIIFTSKLYQKGKLTIFIFHLAFVLILLGAAVTRFIGYEGVVHVREGSTTDQLITSGNYFSLSAGDGTASESVIKAFEFSAIGKNRVLLNLKIKDKPIEAGCFEFLPYVTDSVIEDAQGKPFVELVSGSMNGRRSIFLGENQVKEIGNLTFSLNNPVQGNVKFSFQADTLSFIAPFEVVSMNMQDSRQEVLQANRVHPFHLLTLYNFNGVQLEGKNLISHGKIQYKPDYSGKEDGLPDLLRIRVSVGNESKEISMLCQQGSLNNPVNITINGIRIELSYGAQLIRLPFVIRLNDFILTRYPGSNSPSSFESNISLIDSSRQFSLTRKIYMNNVLKYGGYRFYQTSYDPDELGTVLSVNHDYWGTGITYAGYLSLFAGIVLSLLNRKTRFRKLSAEIEQLRKARKLSGILLLFIFPAGSIKAQPSIPDSIIINSGHASRFGQLLIQDPGGRIKPVQSFSSELLRKVSRKENLQGLSSEQVLLGMMMYPQVWQTVPMIRISHPMLRDLLGVQGSLAPFSAFFSKDSASHYKLAEYIEEAIRKKPASRSTFDNEVIRTDERVSLCYMAYTQQLLCIFPCRGDTARHWYSWVGAPGHFHGVDSIYVANIANYYFTELHGSLKSRNYQMADTLLGLLNTYQQRTGGELIPSSNKVHAEIIYNRLNIFDRLSSIYGLLGFILLVIEFISIFFPALQLRVIKQALFWLILLSVVTHAAGLVLRWYISGHAPWSNGFESMIYIAFATMVAGIIFSRKTTIALAATAILASLILFVAHLSWMDPEITNLVPVLKSYWLVIHVAIITGSYGFLGLGALLALINLLVMIIQTKENYKRLDLLVMELSAVVEMTLIIGLYMVTIGTFLGGVWANESWGRYWGWDPKETWALVTVLVYAFVAHMRLVPGLKGTYLFNLMAVLGFSSVIMTYFGVNYYLSGLHSYAKGDPLPVPVFVYYTITGIVIIALVSGINHRTMKRNYCSSETFNK